MEKSFVCGLCGVELDSKRGLGIHKSNHSSPVKEWKKADVLERLYVDVGLSSYEIAEKYDIDPSTVRDWMEKHGIDRNKARDDPTHPPNHKFHSQNGNIGSEYEWIETMRSGEKCVVQIHRLLAYAIGEISFEDLCRSDIHVHHKSGHGLDNRPENLERKVNTQHHKDHLDDRYDHGDWRDKEKLQEALEDNNGKEVAEMFGCSPKTIYNWKQKHGIK